MERWIWFLGMAVFYGVLFLWFLNQVKKPDYKKNYVLVKTLQSAAFVSVFLAAASKLIIMKSFYKLSKKQQLSVGIFWISG